jgi:hypothetical protein
VETVAAPPWLGRGDCVTVRTLLVSTAISPRRRSRAYERALTESHQQLVQHAVDLVWIIGEMEQFDLEERDKPADEERGT